MSKAAESYRELEKVLREAADKAAACAEVEEKENPTREEREEFIRLLKCYPAYARDVQWLLETPTPRAAPPDQPCQTIQ